MKKVLYIVFYYPPIGGSGVHRGVKFTRYLPEFNWDSVVLTPDPKLIKQPKDYSLLNEVSPEQKIHHFFTLDARWLFKIFWGLKLPQVVNWLNYHIFKPDADILALPFLRFKISQLIKKYKIDLIFISGPPFSLMLNVLWLKKKYPLPVIVDFRDDWSMGQSRLDNPPPESFRKYEVNLEHEVLSAADKVIVANEAIKNNFLSLHPDLSAEHFVVITNGYDEKDFQKVFPPRETEKDKLQIVYIGSLYGRRQPGIVWQVLIDLVGKGKINPDKISIHLYGPNYRSFVFNGFENNKILEKMVNLHPYLPHSQVPQVMSQADVLWLFIGSGPKSDAISTGKIFEYMRSGKPIWAVINPQGIAADILKSSGLACIADNENPDEIASSLVNLYKNWQEGKLTVQPNWNYIHSFERRELTKKLAEVFEQTLTNVNNNNFYTSHQSLNGQS